MILESQMSMNIYEKSRLTFRKEIQQDCSYQGKALNVPIFFSDFYRAAVTEKN